MRLWGCASGELFCEARNPIQPYATSRHVTILIRGALSIIVTFTRHTWTEKFCSMSRQRYGSLLTKVSLKPDAIGAWDTINAVILEYKIRRNDKSLREVMMM